jgi:NAD(P)H dehydrogenase (quinone)
MILVTGASGQVGRRVTERLSLPHALLTRKPLQTDKAVRTADYADKAAMVAACQGIETLFLVSGREDRERLAAHRTAVDAAVEAGVSRIVYLSFEGAAPDCTFTFGRDHWHTEQHILATGLNCAFLRDNMYQEMLPRLAGPDGVIRGPAGDGRLAAVSYDDVADSVVAVLESDISGTRRLSGPEALTLHEAAEILGLRYEPETLEGAYAARAHYGAPDFEVAGWVTSYVAIANGELAEVTGDVEALTGHRPKSLREMRRPPIA